MVGIDPTLLQVASDVSTTAYDVRLGAIAFNYPWGDNLADEGFVGALVYLVKQALKSWEAVEADRAVFGNDADNP